MLNTLVRVNKRNKEPFFATPRSVQKAIPIVNI